MHPRYLAQRNEDAHARILKAAKSLGKRFDLNHAEELEAVSERDPEIQAMRQREVIADLLDSLVDAQKASDKAQEDTAKQPGYIVKDFENHLIVQFRDENGQFKDVGELPKTAPKADAKDAADEGKDDEEKGQEETEVVTLRSVAPPAPSDTAPSAAPASSPRKSR